MFIINDQSIKSFDYISEQLNRYLSIIIFLFGTIGNLLNCIVLSQRTLRSNPCASLFVVSSFINLISILIGLTTRILAGWNLDPTTTNHFICKSRAFIVFSTRTMAIWLIMLATIDRWFLSSMNFHRRQMSSIKNVKRGIFLCFVLSILSYIHMFYCYESNRIDGPLKCYGKSLQCRFITDLVYLFITIIIPSILMIIFSLMIISNIHQIRIRVQTMTIASIVIPSKMKELKLRKTDYQLLRMLLLQVLLLISFCIPQAIQKFYITFKTSHSRNKQQHPLNHFIYNLEILLAFIASGMPFYIYTLTGGIVFRKALLDLIQTLYQKLTF